MAQFYHGPRSGASLYKKYTGGKPIVSQVLSEVRRDADTSGLVSRQILQQLSTAIQPRMKSRQESISMSNLKSLPAQYFRHAPSLSQLHGSVEFDPLKAKGIAINPRLTQTRLTRNVKVLGKDKIKTNVDIAVKESLASRNIDYFNAPQKKPSLIQIIADNREHEKYKNEEINAASVNTLVQSERSSDEKEKRRSKKKHRKYQHSMPDLHEHVRLYQGDDASEARKYWGKLDQEVKRRMDLNGGAWTLTQRGFVASEKVSPQQSRYASKRQSKDNSPTRSRNVTLQQGSTQPRNTPDRSNVSSAIDRMNMEQHINYIINLYVPVKDEFYSRNSSAGLSQQNHPMTHPLVRYTLKNYMQVNIERRSYSKNKLYEKIESAKFTEQNQVMNRMVNGIRHQRHLSNRLQSKVMAWAKELQERDAQTSRNQDEVKIWTHNTMTTQKTVITEEDESALFGETLKAKDLKESTIQSKKIISRNALQADLSSQAYVKFLHEVMPTDSSIDSKKNKPADWWVSSTKIKKASKLNEVVIKGGKLLSKQSVMTKSMKYIPSARDRLVRRETKSLRHSLSTMKTIHELQERKVSPLGAKLLQQNRKLTAPQILGIIDHPLSHRKKQFELQKKYEELAAKQKDDSKERERVHGKVNLDVFEQITARRSSEYPSKYRQERDKVARWTASSEMYQKEGEKLVVKAYNNRIGKKSSHKYKRSPMPQAQRDSPTPHISSKLSPKSTLYMKRSGEGSRIGLSRGNIETINGDLIDIDDQLGYKNELTYLDEEDSPEPKESPSQVKKLDDQRESKYIKVRTLHNKGDVLVRLRLINL